MINLEQPQIGELVKELRHLTGLSQEKFAAKLGVAYLSVNRWEKNRVQPSPMAVEKIEKELRWMGKQGQDLLNKYFSTK